MRKLQIAFVFVLGLALGAIFDGAMQTSVEAQFGGFGPGVPVAGGERNDVRIQNMKIVDHHGDPIVWEKLIVKAAREFNK